MSCNACKTGFEWNGTTSGKDTTLNDDKCYVAGDSKDAAILIITDIYGHTLNNVRLLADHYAKEANATVYVPDVFEGEYLHPDTMRVPEHTKDFDLFAFIGRHSKEKRWPKIKAFAQTLKSQYPKVAAIGFCYGAWACFYLARDPSLIDVITVAHPSMTEKEDYDSAKVPVQILSPEYDDAFTEELRKHSSEALAKARVPFEFVYFPGLAHGFAVRGDPNDAAQKNGLERAKRCAVNWSNEFLH